MNSQGDLSRDALADIIRELYAQRRSGILHLTQEKISKRIYFRKGSMIFANSDVESDRLGEFLIREGVLDRSSFEAATESMKSTGFRFGRAVVELGIVSGDEMEARVVEQIQSIIYSLFAWDHGGYRFETHENPVDEDIVLNLSTADIILEGTRRIEDPGVVRRILGDHSVVPQHNENPLLLYQKMTLSQSEYFVLSRIDGTSSIGEIFAVSPLDEDETARCLYGLVAAGVVVLPGTAAESHPGFAATESPPPPAPTPDAPAPDPIVEIPPMDAPPVPETEVASDAWPQDDLVAEAAATVSGPQLAETIKMSAPPEISAPPSTEPAVSDETSANPVMAARQKAAESSPAAPAPSAMDPTPAEVEVREDIEKKHASLASASFYDLLGVTPTAPDAEIKQAYYTMAKKYHPDRHHSAHLRDVHGLLEELFSKITHAYQTLASPADRTRYDHQLSQGAALASAAPRSSQPAVKKAEPPSETARKNRAEERYIEGKKHYDEMHYFDAIQCLRDAVRTYPQQRYHKLLAQSLMKNPLWGKEAEEQFREALELDPFDAECHFGLGQIYEAKGMMTRAKKMYDQAVTYDPENVKFQDKASARGDVGAALGGFRRIFGRKKS